MDNGNQIALQDQEDWLAELRLADGRVVYFRHVRPDDETFINAAIRTASRETLLHRFFSPIRNVSPDLLRRLLAIDRVKEACIVGLVAENDTTRIICGARYVRLPKPAAAEIAFTVHDDFQRRGLGTFLLKLLLRLARHDGIRWFEADVMVSNVGMLRLLRRGAPPPARKHCAGDVYHLEMDLGTLNEFDRGIDPKPAGE
jgi:RimJ/RimL family protein N-acetyltransferase